MTATINGEVVGHPSNLEEILDMYPRLRNGESLVITDECGTEIERHVRRGDSVTAEECGVDYDE